MSEIKGDTTTRIVSDLPKPEFKDNSSRREKEVAPVDKLLAFRTP